MPKSPWLPIARPWSLVKTTRVFRPGRSPEGVEDAADLGVEMLDRGVVVGEVLADDSGVLGQGASSSSRISSAPLSNGCRGRKFGGSGG